MDIMQKYRNKFRLLRRCRKVPVSCSQIAENGDNAIGSYRKIGNQHLDRIIVESPYKKRRQDQFSSLETYGRMRSKSQSFDTLLQAKRFRSFAKDATYIQFQSYHYSTEDLYRETVDIHALKCMFNTRQKEILQEDLLVLEDGDINKVEEIVGKVVQNNHNHVHSESLDSSIEGEQSSLGFSEETTVSEEEVSDEDIRQSKSSRVEMRREKLIEEILWNRLRTDLIANLNSESILLKFICQYEGYEKAMEAISECYDADFSPKFENCKEYDLNHSCSWSSPKVCNGQIGSHSGNDSGVDEDTNETLKSNSTKLREVKECLLSLESALEFEYSMLEQATAKNEKEGLVIMETLSNNIRILRYAGDIGKVTALLTIIKTRMTNCEHCSLPLTDEIKLSFLAKKNQLQHQLDDARKLKESIDRRGIIVSNVLAKHAGEEYFNKFCSFISDKVRLVIFSRDVKNRLDLTKNIIEYLSTSDVLT